MQLTSKDVLIIGPQVLKVSFCKLQILGLKNLWGVHLTPPPPNLDIQGLIKGLFTLGMQTQIYADMRKRFQIFLFLHLQPFFSLAIL